MIRLFFTWFILLTGLITNGQTRVTIFHAPQLAVADRNAIREMAGYLQRSTGTIFSWDSVNAFKGKGIYITTVQTDRYKKYPSTLVKVGPEGVYIESDKDFLYITANTTTGMREGLFLYLQQLGFRFYFPNPLWHIIPTRSSVFTKYKQVCAPSFNYRRITFGWGAGTTNDWQEFAFWDRANVMGGAFEPNTGHAYNEFVSDNKAIFEKHPEYLNKPLVNGSLQAGSTLNYASDELAQLAYEWLVNKFAYFERLGQPKQMLSLEPFDGDTYCDLPACKKIGTTASDQVFYFTNKVAAKLARTHPGKLIGMLAYNDHIDIPKYPVADNIFVTLAQGFNRSGYSLNELATRWKTKVKNLGVYDYMAVHTWSNDMPGKGLAANYRLVAKTLRAHYQSGVRAYIAESTYGWINKGLGHYLAARLTWDINSNESAITREFFQLCFPQTSSILSPLFESWLNYSDQVPNEPDLHEWLLAMQSAFKKCTDPVEIKRLEQVAIYLHYVKLFRDLGQAGKDQVTKKATEMFSFLWQVVDLGAISAHAALNEATPPYGPEFSPQNKDVVWKKMTAAYPKTNKEWLAYYQQVLPTLKSIDRNILFPESRKLSLQTIKRFDASTNWYNSTKEMTFRYQAKMIMDLKNSDSTFLRLTVGHVSKAGKGQLSIYAWNDSLRETGLPLKTFTVAADNNTKTIDLSPFKKGRYIITYTDEGNGVRIYFPDKLKFSVLASSANPIVGGAYNYFYFYVPSGTKVFYINKTGYIRLSQSGKRVTDYDSRITMVERKINEEDTGWWLGMQQLENLYFVGIPPLVSLRPDSFFFP